MAKIFVSVCIADKPEWQFAASLYNACATSVHDVNPFTEEKCSGLTYLRNKHVSLFLQKFTDCDYYASLDADLVIYECRKGKNIFDMLVADDRDFVGGVYAKRLDNPRDGQRWASLPKGEVVKGQRLIEMEWLAGGCWLVKRSAMEKLRDAHPELVYDLEEEGIQHGSALFNPYIYEYETGYRKLLSEDWALTQRWKDLGGKLWADTRLRLGHIGCKEFKLWEKK